MTEKLLENMKNFFKGLEEKNETKNLLKKLDKTIQFLVTDGDPILVEVKKGVTNIIKGTVSKPDIVLETDTVTYQSIFREYGVSIGRLWFAQKIWMPYTDMSSPDYPWFGMLVRMGQGR